MCNIAYERYALRPLAAAVIVLFGSMSLATATAAPAVNNCNDSGDGSLRNAILNAGDTDTIDLTQLQCTITLSTGALIATGKDLTISGPGSDKLTIDGSSDTNRDGVFLHTGSGTLELDHMTVTGGYKYINDATRLTGGGCIFSSGNVILSGSTVSYCTMYAGPDSNARGGAIYADGGVILTNSLITGNHADGTTSGDYYQATYGGGVFAKGSVIITNSVVSSNRANYGGGVYGLGTMVISNSTISENSGNAGAGFLSHGPVGLAYSTVSGNRGFYTGGVDIQLPKTGAPQPSTIHSSTIS